MYFLSHCHSDHMQGIAFVLAKLKERGVFLYGSGITIAFLKKRHPGHVSNLVELEIGKVHPLPIRGTAKELCVTLLPAGHCPGSVMFLFEEAKRVLYTGDIRLRVNELRKLVALHDLTGEVKSFDRVYLDTTFFSKKYLTFPSREDSLDEMLNLISWWLERPERLVSLEIPATIGSEFLFVQIARHFRPVHVSKAMYDLYKHIPEMDAAITLDPSTPIHSSCHENNTSPTKLPDMNRVCERARSAASARVIYIKPACITWTNCDYRNGIIVKRDGNRYNVCYSSHCSYEELVAILKYLKPKDVYPCVSNDDREMRELLEEVLGGASGCEERVGGWTCGDGTGEESDGSDCDPFAFLDEPKNE